MTTPQDPGSDSQEGAHPYGPPAGMSPAPGGPPPPPGGAPPPGAVPPGAPPSYPGPGGYGGYAPPPRRRNTGLIVGAIAAAVVISAGLVAGAFALSSNSGDKKTAETLPTKATQATSSPTPTDTPTTDSPTTNAARTYCEKLKTIDHDKRLLRLSRKNPGDVQYAIRKFKELGNAAPPSISADWVKLNRAIAEAMHGQKPDITNLELRTAFDHIRSEALNDCGYTLSGGAFDN
jgi:hypothetical protein